MDNVVFYWLTTSKAFVLLLKLKNVRIRVGIVFTQTEKFLKLIPSLYHDLGICPEIKNLQHYNEQQF